MDDVLSVEGVKLGNGDRERVFVGGVSRWVRWRGWVVLGSVVGEFMEGRREEKQRGLDGR